MLWGRDCHIPQLSLAPYIRWSLTGQLSCVLRLSPAVMATPIVLCLSCILIWTTTVAACGDNDACQAARNELVDSACYVQGNATLIPDYYTSVRAKHHIHGDYGRR